eukprot:s181_g40.t1
MQATPAWWANPGDGGTYVGNGTLFCPKSNFWGDAKDKVAPEVGHQLLGKRSLYVGSEEEAWNAEELVDKWLKLGHAVDQADRAEVQRELAEVGKSAWEWLRALSLNWAHRGCKKDEVFAPFHAIDHSLAQKKVMRRIVCCVARFCAGDKTVEPQPWEEMSMKRGPGHWGTPLRRAYPISWSAVKETFWTLTPAEDAKRQKFSRHLKCPQEWTRTKVEMVHRTGSLGGKHDGPLVMVESDSEWATVVRELVAREIFEAEEERPGDGSLPPALCGMYGIHRSWSLATGEECRLLSLVFDVDLVNVLHKDLDALADVVIQNHARTGRLVVHPQGLKVAMPELYGGAVEVYVLDEIWRRDFVLNKEAPAEAFGLTGPPRRPRLRLVPRGWHNGMIVVHGLQKVTPALKVTEGWPLSVPELDASTGWLQHHRSHEGNLELWLATDRGCEKFTLVEGEPDELRAQALKPWLLRVSGMELHFETKLNPMRLGAESTRGRLLEPMLQVTRWLQEASICPGCLPWTVAEFYENVMFDDQDKKIVFGKIGFPPLHIKGEEFMYCRRPRQFWLRNLDIPLGTDLSIQPVMRGQPHEHFQAVQCDTQLLPLSAYLEQGAERVKPDAGPWPTFTRPVKKTSPPAMAAGVKTASEAAKKRWKGDSFRLQVYHYEEDWLLRDQGGIRRLKAIECLIVPQSLTHLLQFKRTKAPKFGPAHGLYRPKDRDFLKSRDLPLQAIYDPIVKPDPYSSGDLLDLDINPPRPREVDPVLYQDMLPEAPKAADAPL